MPSFAKCLSEAAPYLSAARIAEITRAYEAGRAEGAPDAASAVREALARTDEAQAEIDAAVKEGRPLFADEAEAPETPGAQAEQQAGDMRLAQIRAQFPDLMVQLDGMAAPMRLDDFLAAVKAEADELAADAPLMQVAAECALLNGTA
jgi:hypothetical protein